jgi:hypothetical protein
MSVTKEDFLMIFWLMSRNTPFWSIPAVRVGANFSSPWRYTPSLWLPDSQQWIIHCLGRPGPLFLYCGLWSLLFSPEVASLWLLTVFSYEQVQMSAPVKVERRPCHTSVSWNCAARADSQPKEKWNQDIFTDFWSQK